ncbi:unnamed protein product [Cladocopium goreaui]|uniref:Chaperone protein DnaJ n=1 Tax=Cladocopium goreaui TaxID=2562237 RepID=A0A9P1FE36_9DINO|nr:unnamed protein product [Cladocopium goreaui]
MAPANKGQKAESVNFVTKASPTCEGALRFESASQRGQYLAFFPPCHLRVVPFLEDAEERVLDFLFVDFESMFKFITLEEVLEPIFSESPGAWIDLAKLRDDEAVKSHFKEVMGKEVWDVEDFQVEMGAVGMQRIGETSKIFQVVKPLTISWERIPSDIE